MGDPIVVTGVVLSVMPIGDYDKRVILLTEERGRITAFARGARRPSNQLMAATNPFVFAKFTLYEGRNSYTLVQAQVSHYFTELASEQPEVYYGFYFMELADYYGQENLGAANIVTLLFVTIKAMLKHKVPLRLIRRIYELKLVVYSGEYATPKDGLRDPAAQYALEYVATVSPMKLYSFILEDKAMADFEREVIVALKRCVDRPMKSLDILETIDELR